MKILSWYIRGIKRGEKQLIDLLDETEANICCIQRTITPKIPENLKTLDGYELIESPSTDRKHNGLVVLSDTEPEDKMTIYKDEKVPGNVLKLEFKDFYLYNVYLPLLEQPNLEERIAFINRFIDDAIECKKTGKPVILSGLFNIAPEDIDTYNPETPKKSTGAKEKDREILRRLLSNGFIDTYRVLNSEGKDYTSWASLRDGGPWVKEEGWRTDLFLTANVPVEDLEFSQVFEDPYGSDHAPILLDLKI